MSFNYLPVSSYCCDEGFNQCEKPILTTQPDCGCFGPPGEPCVDCLLCCSLVGFVIDIITLIPRGFNYGYKHGCNKCKNNTNTNQEYMVEQNL